MNITNLWEQSRRDGSVIVPPLLFLSAFWVFATGADRLGFYFDDGAFLFSLARIHNFQGLCAAIRGYVPGRNLHILWQYLFYAMVGDPVAHLAALHRIQAAVDAMVVVLFYLVLRRLRLSVSASLMASSLFAFWPVHGETHFWMCTLPMNIMSTAFVLAFALTSLSLVKSNSKAWIWSLDLLSFWCGMLTYDQAVVALVLIAALRTAWVFSRKPAGWRGFLAMHVLHALAPVTFVWLRVANQGANVPMVWAGAGLWNRFLDNVRDAFRTRLIRVGFEPMSVAGGSVWVAFGVALIVFLAAAWFLRIRSKADQPSCWRRLSLLALAVTFWAAAYTPAWLWYPSFRHHYLPTVGLFCAVAVMLDWLESVDQRRILSLGVYLGLGIAIGLSAAATLGESRCWQDSYVAKAGLLRELRPQLAGKLALVLEGFPPANGPANFIAPHDAFFGPVLLLRDLRMAPGFQGALGATRADGVIVLDPGSTIPGPAPQRLPQDAVLWVRYTGFQNAALRYSVVNPRE